MTPASVTAHYRDALTRHGEPVGVRRYVGESQTLAFEVQARARVRGYQPDQIVGDVQQGDQNVILLAADLNDGQFSPPILPGDKIVIRGRETNVEAVDDNSRRVGTALIAYELRVRG